MISKIPLRCSKNQGNNIQTRPMEVLLSSSAPSSLISYVSTDRQARENSDNYFSSFSSRNYRWTHRPKNISNTPNALLISSRVYRSDLEEFHFRRLLLHLLSRKYRYHTDTILLLDTKSNQIAFTDDDTSRPHKRKVES